MPQIRTLTVTIPVTYTFSSTELNLDRLNRADKKGRTLSSATASAER